MLVVSVNAPAVAAKLKLLDGMVIGVLIVIVVPEMES